jgi:hypothetical protein
MLTRLPVNGGRSFMASANRTVTLHSGPELKKSIKTLNDREGVADRRPSSSISMNSYAFRSLIYRASEFNSKIFFRCWYAITVQEDHITNARQVITITIRK